MAVQGAIPLGAFKAWLSLWIALAMAAGLALGWVWPEVFAKLGSFSFAQVNPVTAILVWLLILPTMVQIDYSRLFSVWTQPEWRAGSVITLTVNLGFKAILDGTACCTLFQNHIRGLSQPRWRRPVHRGSCAAWCGPLHGDGIRLVTHDRRGCRIYAGSSVCERPSLVSGVLHRLQVYYWA